MNRERSVIGHRASPGGASPILRVGTRGDARALADLHLRTALFAYAGIFPPAAPVPTLEETEETWTRALAADAVRAFVAETGGRPVGAAIAGPDGREPSVGHLSRLYVDPDVWGLGIGRTLYDACLAYLADRSFTEATLWVLEGNDPARAWYERLGWRPTGERKAVFAPVGIDDLCYRLRLIV